MKRLFIVGLFCSAFLAVRFWGESPVAEIAVAESAGGQGGGVVSGNGDVNADNGLDLSDAIYLLTHLFQGGPAPELCPLPAAGAGGGSDDVGGGGGVGLGLPDTGATVCWDTRTVPCVQQVPLPIETACDDDDDNDGDGRTDCDDSDCDIYGAGPPGCVNERHAGPGDEAADCDNGIDDDGDGFTDCDDPDCAVYFSTRGELDCGPVEKGHCADMLDNDSDGLTDCADPDCASDGQEGVVIPCSQTGDCPGQDAFYSTGCPAEDRYGARSHLPPVDGVVHETVTDRCTGLMWQREMADLSGDGLFQVGFKGDRTHSWCEALKYCDDLTYAGFSDWRLPNVRELESLADRSGPLPPAFGTEGQGFRPYYWSSTPSTRNPVDAVEAGVNQVGASGTNTPIDGLHVPGAWTVNFADSGGGQTLEGVDINASTGWHMSYIWADGGNLIRAVRDVGGAGAQAGAGGGVDVVSGNGDVNADNGLDLSDAIYLLAHLFQGGPPPAPCPGTPLTETQCDDTQDNDGDGATDCDDPDCSGLDGCPEAETDCTNGQDDDDDGDIDCADPDCSDDLSCPEDCEDGVDNDADGDMDCSDSECTGEPQCETTARGELPRTGMTKCYGANGEEIACANNVDCPGQDGDYLNGCSNAPRFVDHGDGTVTDTCTKLMWQQDTADIGNNGTITEADDVLFWCEALRYCEDLTFPVGGHTDWRLPNARELHSIVDFSREDPAIDTDFFAATTSTGQRTYATSTSLVGNLGDCEALIFFDDGRMSSVCRAEGTEQALGHVRAVRDAP